WVAGIRGWPYGSVTKPVTGRYHQDNVCSPTMREVRAPIGCASRPSRPCRTAIVLIAAWLVVLQAFLAGVPTARAGAMPISSPVDVATICPGAGSNAVDDTTAAVATARHSC